MDFDIVSVMNSVRMQVLGVFGGSVASPEEEAVAERIGGIAATLDWVVLTGGGPGVMAAASRGAVEAGGLTVAILPSAYPRGGYPNKWVHIPIFTGAENARNNFNVLSASLCVAIGGGAGTMSEIALALKNSVPVWSWGSWSLNDSNGAVPDGLRVFEDENELIVALEDTLV